MSCLIIQKTELGPGFALLSGVLAIVGLRLLAINLKIRLLTFQVSNER